MLFIELCITFVPDNVPQVGECNFTNFKKNIKINMETEDKFKNSPIHDKRAILEMMDKLEPKEMVKIVDFIQEQVKLFYQPAVSIWPSHNTNKKWQQYE